MRRIVLPLAVLALIAAGCAKNNEQTTVAPPSGTASFTLGSVQKSVEGNVVTIPVTVHGITIVKANGDTSGRTGHFHVFVDMEPPAVGATIPKGPGIVHTAEMPIELYGQKVGAHTYHIVLGDGVHRRLPGAQQTVTVDVKGPSVWGTAPATITKGEALTIQLHSQGFELVSPSGSSMPSESPSASSMAGESASPMASAMEQGHYHILVDPSVPPKAGAELPAPEPNKVIHTGASSVTINDLGAGEHTIWIVAGSMSHVAFSPAVMDKLTVTVS